MTKDENQQAMSERMNKEWENEIEIQEENREGENLKRFRNLSIVKLVSILCVFYWFRCRVSFFERQID